MKNTFPDIPPLDFTLLLSNVAGNMTIVEKMVSHVVKTLPEQIDNLGRLLKEERHAEAARLTHTLKGSLANFGADRAVGLAATLENLVKTGARQHTTSAYISLQQEAGRIVTYLEKDDWRTGNRSQDSASDTATARR